MSTLKLLRAKSKTKTHSCCTFACTFFSLPRTQDVSGHLHLQPDRSAYNQETNLSLKRTTADRRHVGSNAELHAELHCSLQAPCEQSQPHFEPLSSPSSFNYYLCCLLPAWFEWACSQSLFMGCFE